MEYEITKNLLSTELRLLFLCGIWAFNLFSFFSSFMNLLFIKSTENEEKKKKIVGLILLGVCTIASFVILIIVFSKL